MSLTSYRAAPPRANFADRTGDNRSTSTRNSSSLSAFAVGTGLSAFADSCILSAFADFCILSAFADFCILSAFADGRAAPPRANYANQRASALIVRRFPTIRKRRAADIAKGGGGRKGKKAPRAICSPAGRRRFPAPACRPRRQTLRGRPRRRFWPRRRRRAGDRRWCRASGWSAHD